MSASWNKEILVSPDLYNYEDSEVERSKIIGYYSYNENSEPIENLSGLKYLSWKPGMINLDVNWDENEYYTQITNPFFKFIASNKEIIHRYTGTGIEDVGFVSYRNALSKIGSMLFDDWGEMIICAHLFKGVIYIYHQTVSRGAINTQFLTIKNFKQYLYRGMYLLQYKIEYIYYLHMKKTLM